VGVVANGGFVIEWFSACHRLPNKLCKKLHENVLYGKK
jgi:hypothetical protein